MAKVDVIDRHGAAVRELELADALFAVEWSEGCVYDTVRAQLAGRRAGTACTKGRAEVSGSGRKLWKQKKTGRARVGSIRSPLWRGGGTVFGPKPRDYSYSVPKKVRREALKSAIRLRLRDGGLRIVDSLDLDEPKTKKAIEVLKALGLASALIVTEGENRNLELAVRNLKDYKTVRSVGVNVFDVLRYKGLVMTQGALEKVEAMIK